MYPVMGNILRLAAFIALFLSGACSLENPENAKKFEYNFEGTTFRQIKFRAIANETAYRFQQGIRTIKFVPNEYQSMMNGYLESGLIPCYGTIKGTPQAMDRDSFLAEVNGEDPVDNSAPDTGGYYDVFDPYNDGVVESGEVDDNKVDVVQYYFVITVTNKGTSPGCPIITDTKLYYQYLFYQNGDLVMRDYNREIEFFLRPQ